MYDTFGFPLEITEALAAEHGLTVDTTGFTEAFEKHQELSKAGADKVFKGGLADHGEATTKLHTATHLLHKALRSALGDHVAQKWFRTLPPSACVSIFHTPIQRRPEEIVKVEGIVNEQINRDLSVSMAIMPLEEARKGGAIALFGEKYEDVVKVYTIGDFSKEVCGGPHVEHTAVLGHFKIAKEQSSSQGVRRIKAVLEQA